MPVERRCRPKQLTLWERVGLAFSYRLTCVEFRRIVRRYECLDDHESGSRILLCAHQYPACFGAGRGASRVATPLSARVVEVSTIRLGCMDAAKTVTTWLTTAEAAEHAKCSTRTVLNAARAGELVGYQRRAPNGTWRFKITEVDTWLEGR